MSAFSKQAPLETYLKGVTVRSTPEGHPASPSTEGSPEDFRRVVILTILDQADGPVPEKELEHRSELAEWYHKTAQGLVTDGHIALTAEGVTLTGQGREAAMKERSRLLNI